LRTLAHQFWIKKIKTGQATKMKSLDFKEVCLPVVGRDHRLTGRESPSCLKSH
jgi:hypothetical protein